MTSASFPPRSLAEGFYWLDRVAGIFTLAELALVAIFALLALVAPRCGRRTYERIERQLAPLANSKTLQILAVGLLAILARAAVLPWMGAPAPAVHDEQSLVLQAQTYMAGRLANPTHPFWEHFETFHLNQIPAYASMYFPGRGAPLAAGLLLADHPWAGVWLSFILMCMAAVWMLQGWVSPPLALLGGVLVVIRLGVFSYWINSYWGGAFTALGAMLVVGALPRILKVPRWRHGAIMGLGAAILMTTRPYEGLLICLPVAIAVLARLVRPAWEGGRLAIIKVVLPAALLVGAGGTLLLTYNAATTGSSFKTPYSLNREAYANAPAFLTSPPITSQNRGPSYFRDFYKAEAEFYERRSSPVRMSLSVISKLLYSWNFYIGAIFSIAFFAGLWCARRDYFLLGTSVFFFAGYALETWNFPHYTAPVYPIFLILMMRGFGWLRTYEIRTKPVGLFLTRAMPTAAIVLLALPISSIVFGTPPLQNNSLSSSCCAISDDNLRSKLTRQLLASPGRDLVLVKDGKNNPIHFEMIYNEANIDNAEIVWARRLSAEKDLRLQHYFSDRRVWEFEWLPETELGYRLSAIKP